MGTVYGIRARVTVTAIVAATALTAATERASAQGLPGQSAGPVPASATALGLTPREALNLERQWDDLDGATRRRVSCAGTRGACNRGFVGNLRVFRAIPDPFRVEGARGVNRFINGREWSHIVPRSAGGDDSGANGRWEPRRLNRARGNRVMTPAEVRHAEQLARSAGWQQRINSAARRAARGAAIGGVVVTATTVIRLGLDYHAGRITDEQYFARLAGVVARDAAVAVAVAAVLSMVGTGYPVLAPAIAPIAAFLVMEMWSLNG